MPLISVIMPALDEALCIQDAVGDIPVEGFKALGFDSEIIVVDNGSTDETADFARKSGARVVTEPRRGYGHAYKRGFKEARGEVICTLDADGTYPAEVLPELVSKLVNEELAFISTDRFAYMNNGVMTRTNRLGNSILTGTGRVLFDLPFRDSQSGMWVFSADLLKGMQLRAGGMALSEEIKIEAVWRLNAKYAEVPIRYSHRRGVSKLRVWRDGANNLLYLFRKRIRITRRRSL
jgi:glycosyltransferase involved in cell wall biosynthesis